MMPKPFKAGRLSLCVNFAIEINNLCNKWEICVSEHSSTAYLLSHQSKIPACADMKSRKPFFNSQQTNRNEKTIVHYPFSCSEFQSSCTKPH